MNIFNIATLTVVITFLCLASSGSMYSDRGFCESKTGRQYGVGETWYEDSCILCTCITAKIGRNKVKCDRLVCDDKNECEPVKLIKTPDQCCPVCAQTREPRDGCSEDVPAVTCISDPCLTAKCHNNPDARCEVDKCGECTARFYNVTGAIILDCHGNTTKNGTCVTVGGNKLCNVTVAWTPRVSETGAIFAMIVPVLFTVVMFVLLLVISSKAGYTNPWILIKNTYMSNTDLLYAKKHLGSAQYGKIKREFSEFELKKKELKQYSKFYINGEVATIPVEDIEDNLLEEEIIINFERVTKGDVKESKIRRQILGCITLPSSCAHILLISQLIILPIIAILWDMVDVLFDTYYFYKLERGELIDPLIYRNTHVNNSILGFACLGAIKSIIVAFCYIMVVQNNKNEREGHYYVVLATLLAVSFKLLLEDAPELILEYFYVDKFIINNPPWFLVGKDVITALMYILPVIKIVKSGFNDFKLIKEEKGSLIAYLFYIPATLARGFISFAMIFRIVGMIIQYMGSTVNAECFVVFDNALQQTPFALGCLNWCDYAVLVLTCLTLLSSIPPAIIIIIAVLI